MQLTELGEDVLYMIVQKLSAFDIFNLSLTSKEIHNVLDTNSVYRLLCTKLFGSKPIPLTLKEYNWKKIFKLRSSPKAHFYTWGSSLLGRLGYTLNEIPSNHVSIGFLSKNVNVPTNVTNFNSRFISDISSSGYSFQILLADGSLYYTGASWKSSEDSKLTPGPYNSHDFTPKISLYALITSAAHYTSSIGARRLMRPSGEEERPSNGNSNSNYGDQSSSNEEGNRKKVKETNFVTKLDVPQDGKIISISSGREHVIALDENNNLYTWDSGNRSKMGVKLRFPDINEPKIIKISAGWNLSACQVEGKGILAWYSREPLSKENYENESMTSNARYIRVPGTSDEEITDFIAGCDYILFIKSDGLLYKFSLNAFSLASGEQDSSAVDDIEPMEGFNQWIKERRISSGIDLTFTKLNGCYNKYVVFANDGLVLQGDKSRKNPEIIPELQNKDISSVAIGDHHFLALTDTGDLLSWGTESNQCGCLGIGSKQEILETYDGVVQDLGGHKGIKMRKPAKVISPDTPGKWLATSAAGWHSCGIFVPSSQ